METFNIGNTQCTIFAKYKGSNDNKFNRAAKLAHLFNSLENKFGNYVNDKLTDSSSTNFKMSLATLMLMHTGIRVGNEDSAEGYMTQPHPNQKDKVPEFVQTYGLTTIKAEHVNDKGDSMELLFLGKKCVENTFTIKHPTIIAGLRALLASTQADKYLLGVTDSELTKFIKSNVGEQFSPKDFRTLRANIEAWRFLSTVPEIFMNKANCKAQIAGLYRYVSSMLNNTPSIAKKAYVSPAIIPYMELIFK